MEKEKTNSKKAVDLSKLGTKERMDMFVKELKKLLNKYGYENISICGSDKFSNDKLMAVINVDKETISMSDFAKCLVSIARLYQFARERMLDFTDKMISKF